MVYRMANRKRWNYGEKLPRTFNIYDETDLLVCQCSDQHTAAKIADSMNLIRWLEDVAPATLSTWREHFKKDTTPGGRRTKLWMPDGLTEEEESGTPIKDC